MSDPKDLLDAANMLANLKKKKGKGKKKQKKEGVTVKSLIKAETQEE